LQVVDRVLLEVELLLPLVRVSLTCMSVEHLQLLQTEAIGERLLQQAAHACHMGVGCRLGNSYQ
jgi:hypothetical protein